MGNVPSVPGFSGFFPGFFRHNREPSWETSLDNLPNQAIDGTSGDKECFRYTVTFCHEAVAFSPNQGLDEGMKRG